MNLSRFAGFLLGLAALSTAAQARFGGPNLGDDDGSLAMLFVVVPIALFVIWFEINRRR